MADEETVFMLELERRLSQDASGEYKNGLRELLKTYADGVKKSMDAGMAPADFNDAKKLLAGLDTASEVLGQAWKNIHG